MELPSEEDHEMPIPLNSTYVHTHAHMMHNHDHPTISHIHKIPPSNGPINIPDDQAASFKKTVRYKECLKNHAASMGGSATDGCGEFMPSGEETSLICSACNCHRNFHRKEETGGDDNTYYNMNSRMVGRKLVSGHNHSGTLISSRNFGPPHNHHPMIMPVAALSESDEQYGGGGGMRPVNQMVKKRFRTKFSQEQKDKMQCFAEKVGWKIQKQEESLVQQFCQEIGVKRRVLKVWMHNNKHNLAKKAHHQSDAQNQVLVTDD